MAKESPKKILIMRTDKLGDVILSTPVIENLRIAFKHSHIAFLCRPYTKDVIKENPYLDEVIIYDKYGKHKSLLATIKFALGLRAQKFDWALILHPTNRTHLIAIIAGIPLRVGWDKKMSFTLNKKIPHRKQEGKKHESQYTLDMLRALEVTVKTDRLHFPLNAAAKKSIEKILKEHGVKEEDKLIVIHPAASCPSKRWSQKNFSGLTALLLEKTNAQVIIVTSAAEKKFGQLIVEENKVIDLRGELSILELGALLARANIFISNDSGPVHIAASLGVEGISLFGRKDPGLSRVR